MSEFENFVDLGENELKKIRDKQSETIKKINNNSKKLYIASFIAGLAIIFPLRIFMSNLADGLLFSIFINLFHLQMAIIVAAIIIFFANRIKDNIAVSEFKESFKSQFMRTIIKEISPDLNHDEKGFIKFAEFDKPMIYKEYILHTYYGNDLIYGEIDGVKVKFSDVCYTRNSIKLESYPIFQGIVFIADFNKLFKSRAIVLDKKDYYAKCVLDKTKMDNIEFNEIFDTYCFDEINARYILSPVLMEKLIALRKSFNTTCNICFMANQIYIYINLSYDSFEEFDYSKPVVEQNSVMQKWKNEIIQFIDIVRNLNLNSKIFKPNTIENRAKNGFNSQDFRKNLPNLKPTKTDEKIEKSQKEKFIDDLISVCYLLLLGVFISVLIGGAVGVEFFIFFEAFVLFIWFFLRTPHDDETEIK